MTAIVSPVLSSLREASIDRHNRAVQGLRDGSITVTITREVNDEIRALVKNGDGIEYGVTLTAHGAFCSCKDSLYRGTICKHSVATALFILQERANQEQKVHLMWESGALVCDATLTPTTRFWRNWTLNALNWSDIVCQTCVHAWLHPAPAASHLAA